MTANPTTAHSVPVSAMIFTLNEEIHLPSCIDALTWCDDIIVVDSFSTDRTREICEERGVRFYQHAFEGFGSQRNWALDNIVCKHDWVLILDADERTTPEMAAEMARSDDQRAGDSRRVPSTAAVLHVGALAAL